MAAIALSQRVGTLVAMPTPAAAASLVCERNFCERKKTLGKKDVQTIPLRWVTGVHHDRKTLGTDEARLDVGAVSYEWKVKQAEQMVAELHEKSFEH